MSELIPFQAMESRDTDGTVRMTLVGELDLAVANRLSARLEQLSRDRTRVRLDLSRLEFIDSTGIRTLVCATQNGCYDGGPLVEVDRDMPRVVRKVIDLIGVAPLLWPERGMAPWSDSDR